MTKNELVEEVGFMIDPGAFTEMDCREGADKRKKLPAAQTALAKKHRRSHALKKAQKIVEFIEQQKEQEK